MARQKIETIRRLELIEASISAIHMHGFAVLTVNQIAKEAQTSTGSIHYYFGGKDALLAATMRHLLGTLKEATTRRLSGETDPLRRLLGVVKGNFDDRLFTSQNCSVWVQFWAYAPYDEGLARLQRLNKSRVNSNLRVELKQLLPPDRVGSALSALHAYMDGLWVEAAQAGLTRHAAEIRQEVSEFVEILLRDRAN